MKNELIQYQLNATIKKAEQIANTGDMLGAFFVLKKFENIYPIDLSVISTLYMDLVGEYDCPEFFIDSFVNNLRIKYEKDKAIFLDESFLDCLASLCKLKKVNQLSRLIINTKSEHLLKKLLKDRPEFEDVANHVLGNYPKLNIGAVQSLEYQNLINNEKYQDIIDKKCLVEEDNKYYYDIVHIIALAHLKLGDTESAIKLSLNTPYLNRLTERELIILCMAYNEKKEITKMRFYEEQIKLLSAKGVIPSKNYIPLYKYFIVNGDDQSVYELSSHALTNYPLTYTHLIYNATSAYNIQKFNESENVFEKLEIVAPFMYLPQIGYQCANSLHLSYLPYQFELDIISTNKINVTIQDVLGNIDKKPVLNRLIMIKENIDNIMTAILCTDTINDVQLAKIISRLHKIELYCRRALSNEYVPISAKVNIIKAIIQTCKNRKIVFAFDYHITIGSFLPIAEMKKYGKYTIAAYMNAVEYLIKNPYSIELNLDILNVCTRIFMRRVNSQNVRKFADCNIIASIILNLYFVINFENFPDIAKVNYGGITTKMFAGFNINASCLGISVIDNKLYFDEELCNIKEVVENHNFNI